MALVATLAQTETTIRDMSTGVDRMDASLGQAKTTIDNASAISHGVATSMYGLRDAMSLSIFGAQPFIGLAGSFDTSARSLDQLGDDVANVGVALQANRSDAALTAHDLADLGQFGRRDAHIFRERAQPRRVDRVAGPDSPGDLPRHRLAGGAGNRLRSHGRLPVPVRSLALSC